MEGSFRILCWIVVCFAVAGCDQLDPAILNSLGANADNLRREAATADDLRREAATRPAPSPRRSDERLRIATFNIQVLGRSKMSKPNTVALLVDILKRFDLIAVQELRSADPAVIEELVAELNAQGDSYDYLAGPRLGRTRSKEQYVFLYDARRLKVDRRSVHTVHDPYDRMHREPFVARFITLAPPPAEPFSFLLVNVHTDPDEVESEMNVLDEVYAAAVRNGGYEDDVIVLGDFNAGPEKLGQLGRTPGLTTVVHDEPTNTRRTRSYDNIVLHRDATREFLGVAGVLDFQAEYDLTFEQALAVSDHFPVWAEFSWIEASSGSRQAAAPDVTAKR